MTVLFVVGQVEENQTLSTISSEFLQEQQQTEITEINIQLRQVKNPVEN